MEPRTMRLSIVVNMYNTAQFLPKCINSLINQDIPGDSYEIILVDDGSTDNSLELAYSYQNDGLIHPLWPDIRIYSHPNKGLAGARNTGVDAAKGEYLCFVDPDDYIETNSLAKLLQQMDNERLDVLRFNYQKIDEKGQFIADSEMEVAFDYSSKIMSGKDFIINRLTSTCYVWAYIYRLDIIKSNNIRFIEGVYFDDTPWLPQVLQVAERVNCIDLRHQYYLQRSGSLVNTVNINTIMQKIDGQMKLIDILKYQMSVADISIHQWYKMMLAHVGVSLLTSVALCDYHNSSKYIDKIRKLLPLSTHRATKKTLRKIILLNLYPQLYMWIIHIKNRKK